MSTFLEIVNDVLVRLREDEVTTISESTYAKLVGKFVNDTKREVEDSWNWSPLRTRVTVTTVAGTTNYSLTGTTRRSRIIEGYNVTQNAQLSRLSDKVYNAWTLTTTVTSSNVEYYRVRGFTSAGLLKIDVYPTPSGVETLTFDVVVPQAEFSVSGTDDATEVTLEPTVIVYGTWSKAISERGEDGGALFDEVQGMYRRAMADAISYDVAQHQEGETDWYAN